MDELELAVLADYYELQILAATGNLEVAEQCGKLIRTGVPTERYER